MPPDRSPSIRPRSVIRFPRFGTMASWLPPPSQSPCFPLAPALRGSMLTGECRQTRHHQSLLAHPGGARHQPYVFVDQPHGKPSGESGRILRRGFLCLTGVAGEQATREPGGGGFARVLRQVVAPPPIGSFVLQSHRHTLQHPYEVPFKNSYHALCLISSRTTLDSLRI